MKCPFCGSENIAGEDTCQSCGENLSSLDVVIEPKTALEAILLNGLISEIPTPPVVFVARNTSLYDAAKKMNEGKSGCVLVMDQDSLVGIVSERDLLYKAFQKQGANAAKMKVESLMTPKPETLNDDDTIAYALNRMSLGGYRHIPILKEKKVVSLVSVQNIFQYIAKYLEDQAK